VFKIQISSCGGGFRGSVEIIGVDEVLEEEL
jgi:hypothetical protein